MVSHLHYLLSLYVLKILREIGQAVQKLQMKQRHIYVCVSSKQKGRCGDWRAEGAEKGMGRTENMVLADMGKNMFSAQ